MRATLRYGALACVSVALAAGLVGCASDVGGQTVRGSGAPQDEERTVAGIEAVELTNEGDLTVKVGDPQRLVVSAQRELLPYIETQVDGGTLVIGTRDGYDLDASRPIRYVLTVPTLKGLTATSSGGIEAAKLEGDGLAIRVTSSGGVVLRQLQAGRLVVELTSSGSALVSGGTVDEQEIRLSSSGSYAADGLASKRATATLTSSGDATIRVSDTLKARLTSSGSLVCIGSPRVDAQTTSSGRVVTKPE